MVGIVISLDVIPHVISNAISERPIPIYGDGKNVRDWLYVFDHCKAIMAVLHQGSPGQTYNIGGNCEKTNIEIVTTICDILDDKLGKLLNGESRRSLINFVKDRAGHDRRYAIDSTKIRSELSWFPQVDFHEGMLYTIQWYLDNKFVGIV